MGASINIATAQQRGAFIAVLRHELLLSWRRPAEGLTPLGFALAVVTLFAFGSGGKLDTLNEIGAGVVATAVLLAMVIAVENMYAADHEDGTLEQMLMSSHVLAALVAAKVLARWLVSAVPLLLISPLLGMMMGLRGASLQALFVALLLATPTLYLLGSFGAGLLVGARRATSLIALLILPMCVPVLIFTVGLVELSRIQMPLGSAVSMLGALLLLSCSTLPLATAAVLRTSAGAG